MKTKKWLVTLLSVVGFTLLFYHRTPGYNVLLYALLNFLLFFFFKRTFFSDRLSSFIMGTYVVSSLAYSLYGSPFALLVVFVTFGSLIGIHSATAFRSTAPVLLNAISNYIKAWAGLFDNVFIRRSSGSGLLSRLITMLRIYWLPLVVVMIFMWLYSLGSKAFSAFFGNVMQELGFWFNEVFGVVGADVVGLMVLGTAFGVIHTLEGGKTFLSEHDERQVDQLTRKRTTKDFNWNDLKYEYRSATVLLVMLNLMLTVFLFLEIKNEWLGWQWDGELLKSYVHTGVSALIVSIFLSIGVVAYFFRANLNFYPNGKRLLNLAYVWVGLNALLVLSVAIRNIHYVQHFALAYKRIGVFVFLLLSLLGLVTLILKIKKQRSNYFLIRWNSLFAYVIIVFLTLFNWDSIIARYNLSHADSAFVHGEFLMDLSDKALPYLQRTEEELVDLQNKQSVAIPFVDSTYLQNIDYKAHIESRIGKFIVRFEKETWLEHTYAEAQAYRLLIAKTNHKSQ